MEPSKYEKAVATELEKSGISRSDDLVEVGSSSNGILKSNHLANGHISNGHVVNGFTTNGFHQNGTTTNGTKPKKQLLLNAFLMNTPGHLSPGLWRHPRNETADYNKLSFWTKLAKRLDEAGFHAMFIADTLGPYDVYKGPAAVDPCLAAGAQFPVNDPLYLVPAMAFATKNLVFGVTASTTYDAPYAHARRFSTVDHLAEGRVAWNIVTSYLESAAKNFGLDTQIEHDERYRIAQEYMDVLYKVSGHTLEI